VKIPAFPLIFFLFSAILAFGQDGDSVTTQLADTVAVEAEGASESDDEESYEDIHYRAAPDSLIIQKRSFNEEKVDRLKSDPDLDYKQPPTVAESLWDRFWAWIGQLLDGMFDQAVNTNWGRVIVYIVGLALFIVLIMLILKVNAFKILYSGEGKAQKYQVLDENIHEMDFEKLIAEAIDQQDYRKGIRLLFLYALKLLADKHLIHWEPGKTNHDYVGELSKIELRTGLNELSFYFDYAWYGNFKINHEAFSKVQNTFETWKTKIS
jgi:hypothetical protein